MQEGSGRIFKFLTYMLYGMEDEEEASLQSKSLHAQVNLFARTKPNTVVVAKLVAKLCQKRSVSLN